MTSYLLVPRAGSGYFSKTSSIIKVRMKILKYSVIGLVGLVLLSVLGYFVFSLIVQPSNDRDWSVDLAVLPYAEFTGDTVAIHNIRNFSYKSVLDYTPAYYDKTFDLNEIKLVDFIVEPFGSRSAHTFLSFGFNDGSQVAISVEVRREENEWFSAFKGFFRKFELTYVIADEKDVLKLRTNYRRGDVYLYPIKAPKEKIRALFVDMLNRTNRLKDKPEFYNTLWSNCTTNIVRHVNNIASASKKIGWSYKYELPAYSGELAYDLGLINDVGTFEEIQSRHNITAKAIACGDCENFSETIRK